MPVGQLSIAIAFAQTPLVEIRVAGNERLHAEDVIEVSGLRMGQKVTRADFDAASQKLFDTGFFTSVNYRYAAKNSGNTAGLTVTLQVAEEHAPSQVEIDIPGVDAERLWQDLTRADPFIRPVLPDNDHAVMYYQRAIEEWLRKSNRRSQIVMKRESDLGRGTMVAVFVPANLPKIGAIAFAGNQALDNAVLQRALAPVAPGRDYTERSFRHILELNVRPLYEDAAYLTVKFPRVTVSNPESETAVVKVEVQEGPAWSLGKVEMSGDGLPVDEMRRAAKFQEGKLAGWHQILASITSMERVLKRDGYLAVSSKTARSFHEDGQVVDLTIQVKKGRQFLFATLQINGFSPALQQQAIALWKLKNGAPMDEPYVNEYIRSTIDSLKITVKSISPQMHIRPGTNLVDLVVTFR